MKRRLLVSIVVVALVMVPLRGQVTVITWENVPEGTTIVNLGYAVVTASSPISQGFAHKSIFDHVGFGVGAGAFRGEIDTIEGSESIIVDYTQRRVIDYIELCFLYKAGEFQDLLNEVAQVYADGVRYTLRVTGTTTAVWEGPGAGGAIVTNLSPSQDGVPPAEGPGGDGSYRIQNPFGSTQVEVLRFEAFDDPTIFGAGDSDFSIKAVAAQAPPPSDDSDGDGMPDWWEIRFGLNHLPPSGHLGLDGAAGDPDDDGVPNMTEFTNSTDPTISNFWQLSEGATGFFQNRLAVVNPGMDTAQYRVDFLTEQGLAATINRNLAGFSRDTIDVNSIPGLAATAVAADVTTTRGGIIVERTLLWANDGGEFYAGHTGKGIHRPRTTWHLAEGFTGSGFDTWILFANANATPTTVNVSYLLETGTTVPRMYTVNARSRLTVYANDIPPLQGRSFSATITSSPHPITVERALYLTSEGRFWNLGHESAAVDAPSTSWFVAEGHTGSFFEVFLLLANPGATTANVTVRYLRPVGAPVIQNYSLPPTSRTTIHVDLIPGLGDTDVSASVESTQPIIVERSQYWPGQFPNWYGAHNSVGVKSAGKVWALAEGEVGGPQSFDSFFLLANPNPTDANVRIRFLRTSGPPISQDFIVPANSRRTRAATEFGLQSGEKFGVLIESLNGTTVVVERAMYWNAFGRFFAAGTNETAVKIR